MKYPINRLFLGGYLSKRKSSVLKNSPGFTLIELLVVIAIIGILASVVLASLNSAREKGRITAIKSNLKNLQSQAELYYNDNGTYAGICSADNTVIHTSIAPFIDALKGIVGVGKVRCYIAILDKEWGVTVVLNGIHYTVGPQGVATFDTSNTASTYTYDQALAACAVLGKSVPSSSQLKALWDIYGVSGAGGFEPRYYRSSTNSPVSSDTLAYMVNFDTGAVYNSGKGNLHVVRCIY